MFLKKLKTDMFLNGQCKIQLKKSMFEAYKIKQIS